MALTAKAEQDNFARFACGIVGTGTEIIRDVLTSFITPAELNKILNNGQFIHPFVEILKDKQRALVYNLNKNGYSKFDINLIYMIITYLPTFLKDPCKADLPSPRRGWNKDPMPEDLNLGDDLERLRILRNAVYAHAHKASITESEYSEHWQQLLEIAGRMKERYKNDYFAELLKLENYKLSDSEVKRVFEEIASWKDFFQDHEIRLQQHMKYVSDVQSQGIKRHISDTAQEQFQEIKRIILDTCQTQANAPSSSTQDVNKLKEVVLEINESEAKWITLSPLQEFERFPFDLLYTSMQIYDYANYVKRKRHSYPYEKQCLKYPGELLIKDGKPVRRAYMLGDAAHGKTSYCLGLLKNWLNAHQDKSHDKWTEFLGQFHFMFYLPLRITNPSRCDVADMICNDIFEEHPHLHSVIRHVLSDDKYRCFIIIDGLDEWNPDDHASSKLKCKAIPNFSSISNSLYFITTRPWKFDALSGFVHDNDRIIEIRGLDKTGIKNLTYKVLRVKYELKDEIAHSKAKKQFMRKLEEDDIVSFMQIPLLAVFCVQIWHEGKYKGKTMTHFYAALLNMLIERTYVKYQGQRILYQRSDLGLPKLLEEYSNITNYASILLDLGKLAFNGLSCTETALVFEKRKLEDELGQKNIKFCLEVGVISHRGEPSTLTKDVKVQFFHKSMQEFLAAIYFATNKCLELVLSSVSDILELSNFIKFIFGMSPSLGCLISKQIVNVVKNDAKLGESIKCPFRVDMTFAANISTHEQLFKNTMTWAKEMQILDKTEIPIDFKVSAVVLTKDCDMSVKYGKEFLCKYSSSILFLYLDCVNSDEEKGISDKELHAFFSNTKSLLSFYVDGYKCGRKLNQISVPTLQTLYVKSVRIQNMHPRVSLLRNMPMLQTFVLDGLYNLGNKDIGLSSDMIHLQLVHLQKVHMEDFGWNKFLQSLVSIEHNFDIVLFETNIYYCRVNEIKASPHFTDVKEDLTVDYGDEYDESDECDNDDDYGTDADDDLDEHYYYYPNDRYQFSRKWPSTEGI